MKPVRPGPSSPPVLTWPRRRTPRRLTWLRRAVGRAPLVVACLILELAPIAAFAIVGNSLLATSLGEDPVARIAGLALVNAYVVCRAVMSILRAFIGGSTRGASLFAPQAETAISTETWVRRIVGVAVFGLAFANIARALGLYRPAYWALVKLVVLIPHLMLVVVTLRCRRVVASFIRAPAGRSGVFAILRNRLADVWHYLAIVANLALWAIWAFRIPNGYGLLAYYASVAILIFALARVAWALALGGIDRAFHPDSGYLAGFPTGEILVARYRPVLRLAVSTIITIVAIGALLEAWGIDIAGWFDLRTLLPMLRTALIVTIVTIAGLTALSAVGVNIAPLLAGAGIAGIAVGFGSQKLVQDVVTGVFLLLENAMQVGDFVTVSGLSGTV